MTKHFLQYWPKHQCTVRCKCGPKPFAPVKGTGPYGAIVFICGKCGKIRSASLAASRYRMIHKQDPYTGKKYAD